MKLNCDLGEGLDDVDALLMPHIDMASIACGGHTGDVNSMLSAIALARRHNVTIGAHPSYPDRENFGRVSLDIDVSHLAESISHQIQQLSNIAQQKSAKLSYIKPHGALYNDALHNQEILLALFSVAAKFSLPLVLQAHKTNTLHTSIAKDRHLSLIFEAFADRAYTDGGTLVSRKQPNAVHRSLDTVVSQALDISNKGGVFSENGVWLPIHADTLCVHSDSPDAAQLTEAIRTTLDSVHG